MEDSTRLKKNIAALAIAMSEELFPAMKQQVKENIKDDIFLQYNTIGQLEKAAKEAANEKEGETDKQLLFIKMITGTIRSRIKSEDNNDTTEDSKMNVKKYLSMTKDQRDTWRKNANTKDLLAFAKIQDDIKKDKMKIRRERELKDNLDNLKNIEL